MNNPITKHPMKETAPFNPVLRDMSVLRSPSAEEITEETSRERRADELFEFGIFDSRSEAQHFMDLLCRRARGERLDPSMEAYMVQVEQTVAHLAGLADVRVRAFSEQSRQDEARNELAAIEKALTGRSSQLSSLKEFAANMRPGGAAADPAGPISSLIEMGQHRVGVLEAIHYLESLEIPNLEFQLKAAKQKLIVLMGSASAETPL